MLKENRRKGFPGDLPHQSWKKDLPNRGKGTGEGLLCGMNNGERGVADPAESSSCRARTGKFCQVLCIMTWGGFHIMVPSAQREAYPVRFFISRGQGLGLHPIMPFRTELSENPTQEMD